MLLKPPPGVDAAPAPSAAAGATPRATMLLVALALLAPFAFYFPTVRSIVATWNSSETFAHGYVIVPISLWLVWRRRANFAAWPARPYWPALVLLAGLGAVWFAGRLGEVAVVMQYAFVAMIPVTALALFGRRLAGSLAFPLLFLLFAVPFGEIFVAPLIDFTANFTVWAIRAVGIPVLRSGTHFELPTGSWSVVEACSGVRYLISSVTLGCLYAYLTYRSLLRRLLFIALAVVVPVFANGLRAFMIVMLGHFSGMKLAVGVDHLIYGWLFFGLVMFLMFWIGSFWREAEAPVPVPAPAGSLAAAPARGMPQLVLAVLALAALPPLLGVAMDRANYNPAPVRLAAPAIGWQAAEPVSAWQPDFMAPDAKFEQVFRHDAAARPVRLEVLYYRNPDRDKALISSVNRVVAYKDAYHEVGSAAPRVAMGNRQVQVDERTLQGAAGNLLVWHLLWVDGRFTTSQYAGKLLQARAKLLLHGDDGAALFLAAPFGEHPEQAREALRDFLATQGGAIEAALSSTRAR